MHKSLLIAAILFSFFTEAQAQMTAVRCNRAAIETYPEDEKRSVLDYLDEGRLAADKFVQLWAEGKFNEIYELNKRASILVQGRPVVEMDLATFEEKEGRITNVEYRSQDIIWYLNDYLIDLRGTVGTWYAVKTTNSKDKIIRLLVETQKSRKTQKSVFEDVFFGGDAPSWLDKKVSPPVEPRNCPPNLRQREVTGN